MKTDKEKLIEVIYNDTSRDDEIDDAVMDISKFDDDDVIHILMKLANEASFDDMIRASAGESLADIWIRRSIIDFKQLGSLTGIALKEALGLIKSKRSDWYTTFSELFPTKVK
ncbi:hypothetical protein M3194_00080 [Paenibacillus glycanilyticus]|uniref:hypothetical protein n=1 Tax=Paenibacillus glycanilyticus TaxID=126569 RepID=UPI00203BA8F3|nr:hypothetical protein [Paenibacillus glycanilyticus]MCM3625756.1 hypothetical protein [Paenibacillus glycanilyticus]